MEKTVIYDISTNGKKKEGKGLVEEEAQKKGEGIERAYNPIVILSAGVKCSPG